MKLRISVGADCRAGSPDPALSDAGGVQRPRPTAATSALKRGTSAVSLPNRSQGPALPATRYSLPATASGFTLVEVLIGATLSGMVMAAVLSSYVFLGKSFARLSNQQILESEARRTLATFAKDVQAATGISGTPSASAITLTLPTTSGITTVAYAYDSGAGTFTRTPAGGIALVLLRNITDNDAGTTADLFIRYYDGSANSNPYDNGSSPYTTITDYASGIRQLSLQFSTQTGVSANGTRTLVYRVASSRLLLRNSALLQ
jgi:type II secretory pathway pseudopilin PulG